MRFASCANAIASFGGRSMVTFVISAACEEFTQMALGGFILRAVGRTPELGLQMRKPLEDYRRAS